MHGVHLFVTSPPDAVQVVAVDVPVDDITKTMERQLSLGSILNDGPSMTNT